MYLLFSWFHGSYQPPAQSTNGLEDNVPDVHDEADFHIPDTQAVLERFMTHMSKLADVEYQVQGPGELRCKDLVSYCCHIISIYLLFALHVPCIYHVYQINLFCIYRKFRLDIDCICCVCHKYIVFIRISYTMHIPHISNKSKLHIQKISIGHTLYMPSI
jgi:hypothetical protein